MKKLILVILATAAVFSVAQEAKADLSIGFSYGVPIRSYRSYNDDCHQNYYRPRRVYYEEPVRYYAPRRVVRYYNRPVYYRSNRYRNYDHCNW